MKRNRVFTTIACLLLTALLFACFYAVWQMDSLFGSRVWKNFYSENKGRDDVIFYGASMVYADVNPAVIWSSQGIASYDLASSGQPMWDTYFCMVESLKTQRPQLLAVECSDMKYTEEYTENRTVESLFGMKPSLNKYRAIKASVKPEDFVDHLLGFPVWHSRFEEINKEDFMFDGDPAMGRNFKGYRAFFNVTPFEELNDVRDVTAVAPPTPRRDLFLKNIIQLSRDEGLPLLLFLSPTNHEYPEEKAVFNYAAQVAGENDIPFVDFSDYMSDMGIDPQCDFADDLHLSATGAVKFSSFLAEYLKDHYDIPDRRGDSAYASWDACVSEWDRKVRNDALSKEEDMVSYSHLLGGMEDVIYVVSMEGINSKENPYIREAAETVGIELESYEDGGVWIFENKGDGSREVRYSATGFGEYEHHEDMGSLTVSVTGTECQRRNLSGEEGTHTDRDIIYTGREEVQFTDHGLNILVYDKNFDIIVDKVGFNTDNAYAAVRQQ